MPKIQLEILLCVRKKWSPFRSCKNYYWGVTDIEFPVFLKRHFVVWVVVDPKSPTREYIPLTITHNEFRSDPTSDKDGVVSYETNHFFVCWPRTITRKVFEKLKNNPEWQISVAPSD